MAGADPIKNDLMGCLAGGARAVQAASGRAILMRGKPAESLQEAQEQHLHAVGAGFAGIELIMPPGMIWPAGLGAPGCSLPGCVVASQCRATNVAAALDEVTSLIARAASIQARCLNLRIPPLASTAGGMGFNSYREAVNFAYGILAGVRFEAEAAGLAVSLEAGAGNVLLSPVELCEIIDAAGTWTAGACIDVAVIAQFGLPEDWIRVLARRVRAVRVHDVSTIVDALDQIMFVGPLIVDRS